MRFRVTMMLAFALMLVAGSALAVTGDIGRVLTGPTGHVITLAESNTLEIGGVVNLSFLGNTVQSGYVILGEMKGHPATDSTRWSDVVVFTNAGHKPTDTAGDAADRVVMVSDVEGAGITDATLAQLVGAGLPLITCADIRNSLSAGWAYRWFESNTGITSWKPTDGSILYYIFSDPTLAPATGPSTLIVLFLALAITGAILIRRKGRTMPERA